MPTIPREIIDHYNLGVERDRLLKGPSQVERIRTQELIARHLPSRPLRIADVGGGTGFYSFWLADMGHEVHFLDAAPGNVEAARELNEPAPKKLASIQLGDARKLSYASESFDTVLMLGPLYHLTERNDRLTALREGQRILKEGGLIFCASISRFASMLDGFFRNLVQDPAFVQMMKQDFETGVHKNPTDNPEYFTTAYFHTVDEITQEVAEAGFHSVKWYAVEGFGWLLPNIEENLKDETFVSKLLDALRKTENEKSLAGLSAHLLTVGVK